jgi:3-oxoacyl-[acyl-carrier-protein] synthase-3
MKKKLNNVKVVSTGRYIPEKIMTNVDFEKIVDTNDEWIYTRTGIKNRHFSEGETTSDLATKAAKNAIEKANYDTSKIDLIIVATFTPDYKSPAVASLVQAKLGLNDQDIACFDINAACTGFIYSLNVASQMLNSGAYQSALVIGAEVISKVINFEDRNTCVLFGDGSGAAILENTSEVKPAYFYTSSKGDLDEIIIVKDKIAMDGKKVYQFATKILEKSIKKAFEDCDLTIDEIEAIIPHQANLRIIESAAKSLNIDINKFFINIQKYGNTSAASIAIALDEYIETLENKENKKIMFVGFGAGYTWGAALLTL